MPKADHLLRDARVRNGILAAGAVAVFLRMASEAWIGEDAFITFRTIDNFVKGYGLRWNVDERVQVFTHPLWMLVNAAVYAITREIPYTVTAISLALSVGAFLLLARRLRARPAVLLAGFFLPVVASKSLAFYGTSGFETPLAFFLLSLFVLGLPLEDDARPIRWGWLALCAALAAVNRLDHILLFAPLLAYLCVSRWRQVKWLRLALGLAPLAAWLLFSLLYYGFAFPNTAPAKLHAGIPGAQYLLKGLLYTANLVRWDPVSVPVLVLALVVSGAALARALSKHRDTRAGCLAALGAGVLAYGAFILRVGGDYLSGRYWAPPLFAAAIIIAMGGPELLDHLRTMPRRTAVAAVAGAVVLMFAPYPLSKYVEKHYEDGNIFLDRSVAHLYLKRDLTWGVTDVAATWRTYGLKLRDTARNSSGHLEINDGTIGFTGFYAGPEVIIIDRYALADPLLARLPLKKNVGWRIGHLPRSVPRGYKDARNTGSLDEMDPALREYYRRLRLVISGPVFDWERLKTIIGFHLGRYNRFLDQYIREGYDQADEFGAQSREKEDKDKARKPAKA